MKIIIDLDRCQGHAQCELAAPEVFRVNEAGLVEVLDSAPGEEFRAKVEDAVWRCPASVIAIED